MRVKDRILYAEDGMVLTDGQSFGKVVVLAVGAAADDWQEITEAEAEAMEAVTAEEALRELLEVL